MKHGGGQNQVDHWEAWGDIQLGVDSELGKELSEKKELSRAQSKQEGPNSGVLQLLHLEEKKTKQTKESVTPHLF